MKGIIDAKLAENPESDFAYVAKLVDTATYERVKALDIPWVVPWEHPSRRYPNGAVAGNLLGFVGDDGDALAGLELSQDECLAGEDGELSYLHSLEDWVQIPGTEVIHKQARDGGTLHLTIDSDLQWMVQRIAEAQVQAVGRRLGHGHRDGGEDRPPPRRGRRADGRPERPGGDDGGEPRVAVVHRAVRARARRSRRSPRHPSSTAARPTR